MTWILEARQGASMTTINMNTFQLPCSSTSDFMARMGVVHAAYNSFAEVGRVPKSPRSKVRTRSWCKISLCMSNFCNYIKGNFYAI